MGLGTPLTHVLFLLFIVLVTSQATFTFPRNTTSHVLSDRGPDSWSYRIPSHVQNGTGQARFNISTPGKTLDTESLLKLDAPQLSLINASVFDWWSFDAVSDTNPRESLVVTFFTSSAAAFPFLDSTESSVLIAYLWASFDNGTVFADFVPATMATVAGGGGARTPSSGEWSSTGFRWAALKDDLSQYEIVVGSEKMQVEGRFTLNSVRDSPSLKKIVDACRVSC